MCTLMSRLKELEEENRRLWRMYIEEKLKAEIAAAHVIRGMVSALKAKTTNKLEELEW